MSYIENAMLQVMSGQALSDSSVRQGFAFLHSNFDRSKYTGTQPALCKVAQTFKSIPQQRISIEGHTENVGQIAVNNRGSLLRAESVRQALIAARFLANRLQVKGVGSQMPLAVKGNETGCYQNRRVELFAIP